MNENSKNNQKIIQKGDEKLESFTERLKRLSEEINNINFDINEVFSKAKSMGYNSIKIKKILTLRKIDIGERLEQKTLLKIYKNALGIY